MSSLRLKGGTIDDLRERRQLKPLGEVPYGTQLCIRCGEYKRVRQFHHVIQKFGGTIKTRSYKTCQKCRGARRHTRT